MLMAYRPMAVRLSWEGFFVFGKRDGRRDMSEICGYTARKLSDMSESLERLARTFDMEKADAKGLSREDGAAALQMAAALVCDGCERCGMREEGQKEDSYYLYYLLRAFEQKGNVDCADMPRPFREACRRREQFVGHLNRNLGKATMNLSWKNRFLESRDAVISQFRELAVMLEEFSRQMEQAKDVTDKWERSVCRTFLLHHMTIERLLVLEYDGRRREAFLTVKTNHGRCVTSADAARLLGQGMGGRGWSVARDSKSIVGRKAATIRFLEEGVYEVLCGVARKPKDGESVSGDNFTFSREAPGQVVMSLSDGMGSGDAAGEESRRVVELTEQLLAAGYTPRSALKLVNTVLLLTGEEQHPATIDLCCVDLYTGVLEAMKLGAAATFILGEAGVELLRADDVPAGVLTPVEPVLLTRKLWEDDRVVMVSDGVLEALPGDDKEKFLKDYLESIGRRSPQELAELVLEFATACTEGARDDMTVLAAGMWAR